MNPETQENKQREETPKQLSKMQLRLLSVRRKVENALFWLILLVAALYFVLQLSAVQNWLIQKVTAYLSEELQTTVSLDHVDVEFFDNVVLENFYVADQKGDTLIFTEKLSAGINSNIFSLFSGKFVFNEILLKKARVNLRQRAGEEHDNLHFILASKLFKKEKTGDGPAKRVFLKIQNLRFEDVIFEKDDRENGQRVFVSVPTGQIRLNAFDTEEKLADIQTFSFDGLLVQLEKLPVFENPAEPNPAAKLTGSAKVSVDTDTSKNTAPKKLFTLKINQLRLKNAGFDFDNFRKSAEKETLPEVIDFNHISLRNLGFEVDSLVFKENLDLVASIRHLGLKEQSGFELTHLESRQVVVSGSKSALYGFKLETPKTFLSDTFEMEYERFDAFNHFNNEVLMRGKFAEGCRLRLGDISFFSDNIAKNTFFKKNRDEVAEISGRAYGFVNKLNGRDLKIKLSRGAQIACDFDGDDLGKGRDLQRISLNFKHLQTNLKTLRDLIPGFNAPEYFNRLGNFNYHGTYQFLFGYNHILNGDISTEIGKGRVDIELDLTEGREKATYSGDLKMRDFDLAVWTGNQQFGKTTFNVKIEEGSSGLTLSTINTTVKGSVDTLVFRGYAYRNIKMDGHFSRKMFNGDLGMQDPNLNFSFDGTINYQDTIPTYNFKADIKKINLGALNFGNRNWTISGKVAKLNLRGNDIRNITGTMALRHFRIADGEMVHRIDTVDFQSVVRQNGSRFFGITSEILTGSFDGNFDLARLPAHLQFLLSRNYPAFAERLGLQKNDSLEINDSYTFNLRVINSKSLTRLAGVGLDTLQNVQALGRVDAKRGLVDLKIEAPQLSFSGVRLEHVSVVWDGIGAESNYEIYLHRTVFGKKSLAPIRLFGLLKNDNLGFNIQAQNLNSILKSINLSGSLSSVDSIWQVQFNPSNLTLFNEQWAMDEDNYVRFGKGFIALKNFDLFNNDKRVFLDSLGGRGLRLGLTNFDLNFLDNFLKIKDVRYRGKIYDFDFAVQDVFKMEGMSLYLNTDTLFIKNQPYGFITGNAEMENLKKPLAWKVIVADKNSRLRLVGGWHPGGEGPTEIPEIGLIKPKEFQLGVRMSEFPMNVLQQYIPGISGTTGKLEGEARLGGPFNRMGMNGEVEIRDGAFQLDYLKSYFYIKNQKIVLNDYQVWADGDTIWDADQNSMALVRGGLRHDHFKRWSIDCGLQSLSDDFAIMNTRKGDNSTFYGQGIGWFKANFGGTFVRTDISVDAVTGKETRLYIPLTGTEDTKDVSFIKFKNSTFQDVNANKKFQFSDLKGLNFEMNLSVTDDAEVQMIFDEQAGDVVKGKGTGFLNFFMNREGEFKMYGNYRIRKGEYLFTLLNFVNKPFTVADGGTIQWFGDPYQAQINLDATYSENTSVTNFLQDELLLLEQHVGGETDPRILAAKKATRVNVTMHLKGDLFKPNISFDLDFPNLPNELKTLADSKLRQLKQDPNELNRQVFGLVVVGSFLPSTTAGLLQSSDLISSTFNTLTQVLTNQFSNYLSTLAATWFGKKISSIDFDLAYNEYKNSLATPGQPGLSQTGRELQVRMSSGLINDRITINVGSQFGLGDRSGFAQRDGFLGEDVTVEIQLTENRQWRLKIYQRTEPDVTGSNLRARYGVGIAFHKEYNSFDELLGGVSGWFSKNKKS